VPAQTPQRAAKTGGLKSPSASRIVRGDRRPDPSGFKQVNDGPGRLAGSKRLGEARAVIGRCARETDVVARFGGDKLALILPDSGPEGATAVAGRSKDRIRFNVVPLSDGPAVRLTASTGVATLPNVAQTAEDLRRVADGIHVA